jgi:hypothetical protein
MEEQPTDSPTPPHVEGIVIPPSAAERQSSSPINQVVGKSTATNTPTKNPKKHYVKAWAWRLTAGYFWVHAVITVVAGRDLMAGTRSVITAKAVMLLSYFGFDS